jgi:3-hydroxyisobutyrate dehydrogenase-like beta-hydroxyacid dehydrogenase
MLGIGSHHGAPMIVGVIGLGQMGGGIARNIVRHGGHEVVVHDLDPRAVQACVGLGATAAGLRALAARAQVIFTSLPTPDDVRRVALGPGGIAEHASRGTVYFDLSTTSPSVTTDIGTQLRRRGITMLDAPVSGGPLGAQNGTLAVMVGGDARQFEAHRRLLEAFAANVFHVGALGCGQVVKIAHNMMCYASVAAAAEGLMLGAAAGADLRVLDEVIRSSTGDSRQYRALADRALSGDHQTMTLPLKLAYKDVHLFLELADDLEVPAPVGAAVHNLMRAALGMGLGELNHTAVIRGYESALGRELTVGTSG